MKRSQMIYRLIILVLLVTACAGGGAGQSLTYEKAGEELFNKSVIGSSAGCKTCHSLEAGVTIIGPSLAGIAGIAAEREPGMSAEEYLRQSILEPDAYVVDDFTKGMMPKAYAKDLEEKDIQSLVAFLLSSRVP
jgi:cytochrome c2